MKQRALLDVDPKARRTHDFYETPAWMTTALLRRVWLVGPILEPCVGDGAIARVLRRQKDAIVITNDIDQSRQADFHLDATADDLWLSQSIRWIVSNPPFTLADAIVPRAWASTRFGGVAMLLRITWLEPTDGRQRFLAEHPPRRVIVLPRWSFRRTGKTDSVTCGWFIWDRNQVSPQGIEIVTKDEMRELQALEHVHP
jgi:hypothetical protein